MSLVSTHVACENHLSCKTLNWHEKAVAMKPHFTTANAPQMCHPWGGGSFQIWNFLWRTYANMAY